MPDFAVGGRYPDLVILLHVPPDTASKRLVDAPDRFERAGAAFHRRVADGFKALAASDERWVVIDGTAPVEVVQRAVRGAVRDRLGL